jgi:ABC-type antimicrobial peptide transport system permease subunit
MSVVVPVLKGVSEGGVGHWGWCQCGVMPDLGGFGRSFGSRTHRHFTSTALALALLCLAVLQSAFAAALDHAAIFKVVTLSAAVLTSAGGG